jgi:kumamolisin
MSHSTRLAPITAGVLLLLAARLAAAQTWPSGAGTVIIPNSSIEQPGDVGVRAHTNVGILVATGAIPAQKAGQAHSVAIVPMQENPYEVQPLGLPPIIGYLAETPASLGCVYHLVSPLVAGCNPNIVTANPTGGSRAIAVVDAYDDPNALSDLKKFSAQFGLPVPNLTVVYASGVKPPIDPSGTGGWELEESLDIEWTHAMAPNARIFLVEAASNNLVDILSAVDVASTKVASGGGGEVCNSYGGSEFSTEASSDSHFQKTGIVYIAASGDSPGTEYPAVSPFVVAAGGTSTTRNLTTGALITEVAWQDGGSGASQYEPRPTYQNAVSAVVGTKRGTPDISFDSASATPVWVYATLPGKAAGWYFVFGTSVAAASLTGIINSAGHFAASTAAELTTVYANRAVAADFHDITLGNCGPYGGLFTAVGYDLCTGVGSDQGKVGK